MIPVVGVFFYNRQLSLSSRLASSKYGHSLLALFWQQISLRQRIYIIIFNSCVHIYYGVAFILPQNKEHSCFRHHKVGCSFFSEKPPRCWYSQFSWSLCHSGGEPSWITWWWFQAWSYIWSLCLLLLKCCFRISLVLCMKFHLTLPVETFLLGHLLKQLGV